MIMTYAEYLAYIASVLPDNSNEQISPEDVRSSLTHLVDSVHNFLTGVNLSALNVGSKDIRTTRLGDYSLSKIDLPQRSSVDNTAVGYYALGGNFSGSGNTAIGSQALGCNLYGHHNVAIGLGSQPGNLTGSGNVAIGNYTLHTNKYGDFNIAIGHGAGYYIGEEQNYKLYIAAHEVDGDSLCGVLENSGAAPLVYGDLKNYKFGIATKHLHDYGTLQVSGDITPALGASGNLGNRHNPWNSLYASSGISYPSTHNFLISRHTGDTQSAAIAITSGLHVGIGTATPSGTQGLVTVAGHIVPSQDSIYRLGHPNLKWDGIFNDIIVSGTASIQDLEYVTMTECLYECKTLHLATSGLCENDIFNSSYCGYLNDEGIDGGGFEIHSSGTGYRRDYSFLFRFADQTLNCLEQDSVYARSHWKSNISIAVESGRHIQTQRVLSKNNLSLVTESGCFGVFIRPDTQNKVYIAAQGELDAGYQGQFNVLYPSGFTSVLGTLSSGVSVKQSFASRLDGSAKGFNIIYHDKQDQWYHNQKSDRISIEPLASGYEAFTVLSSAVGSGLVGISNFSSGGPMLPQTIFNVQSSGGCDARFSNFGSGVARIQLFSNSNHRASGMEIAYHPNMVGVIALQSISGAVGPVLYSTNSPVIDFSLIHPSGTNGLQDTFMTVTEKGYIGIGRAKYHNSRNLIPDEPLVISHPGATSGTISLKTQLADPVAVNGFAKIYVKPYAGGAGQTANLYMRDDGGNIVSLLRNPNNTFDNLLYGDASGNTYGGYFTPVSRPTNAAIGNVGLGYAALSGLTYGSRNVIIGSGAAQSLTIGNDNVVVGAAAGHRFTSASNNVILGAENVTSGNGSSNVVIGYRNLHHCQNSPNNVLVIGSGIGVSEYIADNSILIGHGSNPIISGYSDGAGRGISINDGRLSVYGNSVDQQFTITHVSEGSPVTVLQVKDHANEEFNAGMLSLRFLDLNDYSRTLMDFSYNADPYSPSGVIFSTPDPVRPYVSVSGDLRVLGAIRFANGASIEDGNLEVALDFSDLPDAIDTPNTITTQNSYVAVDVPSGVSSFVGKMTLQALSDYIGSGFSSVSNNCNHVYTNAENPVDVNNNSHSIFVGCDVATAATGWKNTIFIGTEAGQGATTPNVDLATDTAGIFIGYRAAKNADNTENCVFIGTNAGQNASGCADTIFIGSNAGLDSKNQNSIAIGEHALRGTDVSATGSKNIEIVTGLDDNQRLMYGSGNLSNRLNIQNVIAGNHTAYRVSIGHATLAPDAPLSVRKNDLLGGHSTTNYIQTWYCNGNIVAGIDCNGNFLSTPSGGLGGSGVPRAATIEGIAALYIPSGNCATPVSGLLNLLGPGSCAHTGVEYIHNRDWTLAIPSGAFVVANLVNGTYRPVWVSCG